MRRRECGIGRVRRRDGILAEGAELAMPPMLHGGKLDAVGVARDAPPPWRAVWRERDAAALREDAGGLHVEGAPIRVQRNVEGN